MPQLQKGVLDRDIIVSTLCGTHNIAVPDPGHDMTRHDNRSQQEVTADQSFSHNHNRRGID
jgi:hypothetical protein